MLRDLETSTLLNELERYPDLVSGKLGGAFLDKAAETKGWEKITSQLNFIGNGNRKWTVRGVKRKWSNLKVRTKKRAAQINKGRWKTGGGQEKTETLTPFEERVLSLMGKTISEGETVLDDTDQLQGAKTIPSVLTSTVIDQGVKNIPSVPTANVINQGVKNIPSVPTANIIDQDAKIIPPVLTSTVIDQGGKIIPCVLTANVFNQGVGIIPSVLTANVINQGVGFTPSVLTANVINQGVEIIPPVLTSTVIDQNVKSCPPVSSIQPIGTGSSLVQAQDSNPETEADENENIPLIDLKNLLDAKAKTSRVVSINRNEKAKTKSTLDLIADVEKRKLEIEEEKLKMKKSRMENELEQTKLLKEQVNLLKQLLNKQL